MVAVDGVLDERKAVANARRAYGPNVNIVAHQARGRSLPFDLKASL